MSLPVIAITNASTCLTDAQVEAALPALQKQVSNDFKAYWELDCTLSFLTKGQRLTPGWWQIVITDNPDQAGALGYHEMTSAGTPMGKVFAKLDLDNGCSWTVTLSHELLEMLADPWINWCAVGSDRKIYALEVCDAVEADDLGYQIDGVLLSDFVTPAWFEPTEADRLDFKKHVSKRLQLAPGGYISILVPGKGWTQVTAQEEGGPPINAGSRRARRSLDKHCWRGANGDRSFASKSRFPDATCFDSYFTENCSTFLYAPLKRIEKVVSLPYSCDVLDCETAAVENPSQFKVRLRTSHSVNNPLDP